MIPAAAPSVVSARSRSSAAAEPAPPLIVVSPHASAPSTAPTVDESKKSLADIVSDAPGDLEFVAKSILAVVDGVLHIPQSIVDIGVEKLKSALVAQFAGSAPPLRVFHSIAARLWGYEGPIQISLLSEGFYLLEFPSYALSSWVLQRTWHIHHMPMILRRWKLGIAPLALSPTARPTWVTLRDVPPPLLAREGISWLASQLGEPTGKFVRDGLKVKICVFASPTNSPQEVLSVNLGPGSEHIIHVNYPAARSYGNDAAKPVRH
ncbi:hypothetical protein LINGRAHAP2_LOCUS10853 [Linum grandiflorum]